MLSSITPLILTFNEASNVGRTLEKLAWARQIIIVDSYSTDETKEIAAKFANVIFVPRQFDNHAAQWNFGLDQVDGDWVLALDADYVVTDEVRSEIATLSSDSPMSAYFAPFRYCINGRPLRGTLYPPHAVLFRKSRCRYAQDGHTQVLSIEGPTQSLHAFLLHDDRKPLNSWLDAQRRYARLEADKLTQTFHRTLSRADRLRQQIWPAVPAVFFYTLIAKRCLFDGWPGWFYTLQRTYFELLLSLELLDRRLMGEHAQSNANKVHPSSQ
jgi:glycosyltransferase involved in cell wall biosynthesis